MKILDFFRKKKTTPETVQKAAIGKNAVFEAIFRWIGENVVVWLDDDKQTYIEDVFSFNSDQYAIVTYIAQKAKEIPLELYEKGKDGKDNQITSHPFLDVWNKTDSTGIWTQKEKVEFLICDLLTTGDCYIYKNRGLTGSKILELIPMPSGRTEIIYGNATNPIKGYLLRDYLQDPVPADDVIHIKMPNLNWEEVQALYGMSPIKPARRVVTQMNDADTAQSSFLKNGGAVGIMFPDPQFANIYSEIGKDTLNLIKQAYYDAYSGAHQKGKIAFTNIPMRWQATGANSVDLALIQTQMLNFRRLCNIYKVPSVLFNDNESSTFNNVSEAYKKVYLDAIIPTLDRIYDRLNSDLLKDFGLNNHYVCADISGVEVLQKDKKTQVEWMQKAEVFTKNEIRLAMGFDAIKDPLFDTVYISSTYKPIESVLDMESPESQNNDDDDNKL